MTIPSLGVVTISRKNVATADLSSAARFLLLSYCVAVVCLYELGERVLADGGRGIQ